MQITKLHELAIRSGVSSVVTSWREKFSMPDARDKFGNSLLMLAAKYGKKDLVHYFIASGVSPNIRNYEGLSAADLALQSGFLCIYEQLSEVEPFSSPISRKASFNSEIESFEFDNNNELSEWESDTDLVPPIHDEYLAAKASAIINQFHNHKLIDHAKEWTETKIELPSLDYEKKFDECDFPLIQELIAFCITNHVALSEEAFVSAVEDVQISMGRTLPDFFWETLPERLGFSLEPACHEGIEPGENLKNDYLSSNLETNLLVIDALKQWRELSDLWTERYANQFQLREVIDRQKEERLGQRMDSSVLAIRSIAQKPEYQEVLQILKSKHSTDEFKERAIDTDESDLCDESLKDEESGSSNSEASAFIGFITNINSFVDGDSPPRPSHEDMIFITESLKGVDQKLLGEIEDQYKRYLSARNQFFLSNLRLVVSHAKKYKRSHHNSLEDHVQNGFLGLLKAVEKYNYRLGYKFSTYSIWWIRQHITREIANNGNTIRLPVHIHGSRRKLERAVAEQNSSSIDEQILRDSTGLSSNEIEKIQETFHHSTSVDILSEMMPVDLNYSETSLIEGPFKVLHAFELKHFINKAVDSLKPKEAKIIQMRFGLDSYEEHTLEQVGQVMGLTRERIRQIEAQALGKLRASSMFQHFELED